MAARRGRYPWVLVGLIGLTGAAAVYGGAGLIRDGFGMPDGWLAGMLLTGWVLPGVALLIGVALQPVIAGIGAAEILLAWRWQRSGKIVTGSRDQRPDHDGAPGRGLRA